VAGEFSAYAQAFGLTAEYENNMKEKYNDMTGIFNLRIFGNSIQNSYLTLSYGLRTRSLGASSINSSGHEVALRQQLAQASIQMYLQKHFGIDGFYRQYMPTEHADIGKVKGTSVEAGAYIDFDSVRVFGRWYEERNAITSQSTGLDTQATRTGVKTGIKFYF
jgi:hypothetical protein